MEPLHFFRSADDIDHNCGDLDDCEGVEEKEENQLFFEGEEASFAGLGVAEEDAGADGVKQEGVIIIFSIIIIAIQIALFII